ncbi:4-(cytidine 5'-diphospho)-2-C-methyl-D-erythritol kinase [Alterisphingorhabdus coralli]|uniref:4-diphosphocytidyl-2-C-methyl-D-erythritol kinase n=1 Tax=Alterisphingorhabdus coralli TaxID=3071408 RepID=A0AA97HZL5_9SPHN|nr:4-(cytidine 5'-diphospho)-2-C-methyl-D-erythritol kinase [Parasphingorhabdus sp. SCSIO 66989]WOE73967.1 4-(cytidine 5'-diphospho)-2-C-methyl-D-erythritol kinase [Parasphingorhabdus sp. SCSIO 66989]
MPSELSQIAPAKLNLALHVRRRRDDGYHDLETLFCFLGHGDCLTVGAADALSLEIVGPFADELAVDEDNLVLRAARLMAGQAACAAKAHIILEKNLPIASGIGGGSADAAAALRLLNRLWGLDWSPVRLAELGLALGADVPVCVHSRYCEAQGVGDVMTFSAPILPDNTPILLVNPKQAISTPAIFKGWDGIDKGALPKARSLTALQHEMRNDLTPSAVAICPEIKRILDALGETNAELVRMSGSGATCFAVYADTAKRDAAQRTIETRFPDYWTLASHTLNHDF